MTFLSKAMLTCPCAVTSRLSAPGNMAVEVGTTMLSQLLYQQVNLANRVGDSSLASNCVHSPCRCIWRVLMNGKNDFFSDKTVPKCGVPMVMMRLILSSLPAFDRSHDRATKPPMLWQIKAGGLPVASVTFAMAASTVGA